MDVVDKAWDKLENVFPSSMPLRAAMGAGIGYVVMEAVRPEFAYHNERKRPDAYFPDLYVGEGPPTFTPWWTGPLLGAVLTTLFI